MKKNKSYFASSCFCYQEIVSYSEEVLITPLQAMMIVRRYGNKHAASSLGQPALHPATVDLKGKAYEYVLFSCDNILTDIILLMFLLSWKKNLCLAGC